MVNKRKKKGALKTTLKTKEKKASLSIEVEKILFSMPKMIATQIAKDLQRLKQQISQLKSEIKEFDLQKKKIMFKIAGLKKKNTKVAIKQTKTAQKLLKTLGKNQLALMKVLKTVEKQFQLLLDKRNKYLALQAELIRFGKDWAKKGSKPGRAMAKVKSKKKRKSKIKSMVVETISREKENQPLFTTYQQSLSDEDQSDESFSDKVGLA